MSTSANTAVLFPDWKQEVNRRVAAHKGRRTPQHETSAAPAQDQLAPADRAARAAARVAARYANAPSYSEMLAREARAAVHAAKAAAKAAEEAQAAFQYVLEGLGAAAPVAVTLPEQNGRQHEPGIRHATEIQMAAEAAYGEMDGGAEQNALATHDAPPLFDADACAEDEIVEPIYANLIEFPRPMVAARRVRPRRAEGPLADAVSAPQLSIFEVDPTAISIAPAPASVDPAAQPEWMRAELPELATEVLRPALDFQTQPPAMHGDALPAAIGSAARTNFVAQPRHELAEDDLLDEPALPPAPAIEIAPFSRRLLAVVVDGSLIAAALLGAGLEVALRMGPLPGARAACLGAALALAAASFAYYACFLPLARTTPGMWYAGIEIGTLMGVRATRAQRCRRLMAMLLSVPPLGLGVMWALFDDSNLAWHDRLSGTYLRKR